MLVNYRLPDFTKAVLFLAFFLGLAYRSKSQDNALSTTESLAADLAQQQLEAYNNRDITRFLEPYAEDVKAYNYPDILIFEGKDKMRDIYGKKFSNSPELHCELVNRTVMGNVVIDQERVTGSAGAADKIIEVLAIYTIKNGKIAEVRFVRGE